MTIAFVLVALTARGEARQLAAGANPAGTAAIAGRVADARTGDPLAGVIMRLFGAGPGRAAETSTDAEGRYEFAGLGDGEFTVMASNDTHGRACYGATDVKRLQCVRVAVVRDQQRLGVDFLLLRSATLRGRVIDHEQRPVVGARVSTSVMFSPLSAAVTDSSGEFEITNLALGENTLTVRPRPTPELKEPPEFTYPGAGLFLEFEPGMVMDRVVVTLPRIVRASIVARISTTSASAERITAMVASTLPRTSRRLHLSDDGVGAIGELTEGRYFVYARADTVEGPMAAFEVIEVTEGEYDVSLALQPTGRITGRISAERGGLPPLDGVRVAATWNYDGQAVEPLARDEAEAGPDGYFGLDGMIGTRTLQLIGLSPEWRVVSVRHGRVDVTGGVDVPAGTTVDLSILVGRR